MKSGRHVTGIRWTIHVVRSLEQLVCCFVTLILERHLPAAFALRRFTPGFCNTRFTTGQKRASATPEKFQFFFNLNVRTCFSLSSARLFALPPLLCAMPSPHALQTDHIDGPVLWPREPLPHPAPSHARPPSADVSITARIISEPS